MALPRYDGTPHKPMKPFFTSWRLACVAVLALAAGAYVRAMSGMAVWDDSYLIAGSGAGGHTVLGCFTRPFLAHYFRPLTSLSFFLDYKLAGDIPFYYHQTNVLIHVLTTAALIGLLREAFRNKRLALVGGLLFAVQPVQVATVAWIGGRTDSLCALWIAYCGWAAIAAARARGPRRAALLVLSLITYAAALLTKEQALALLPLPTLAFWCFSPPGERNSTRTSLSIGAPFAAMALAFFCAWMLYFPNPLRAEHYSVGEQLALAGRTVDYYSLVLLAPTPRWMHTLTVGAIGRAGAWTVPAGYGLLALYAVLLWQAVRRRSPVGWFVALAILVLLPVSNLIPVPSLVVAPYRAGDAGLGVVAVLAWLIVARLPLSLARVSLPGRRIAWVVSGAVACWYCALTIWGAGIWRNQALASVTFLRYDHDSVFAYMNLSAAYFEDHKPAAAARQTEALLNWLFASKTAWRRRQTAWSAYHAHPQIAERMRADQGNVITPREYLAEIFARLGFVRIELRDTLGGEQAFRVGHTFNPGSPSINTGLGLCAMARKDLRDAEGFFRVAKAGDTAVPEPYWRLAKIYEMENRWPAALQEERGLVAVRPWWGPAYLEMARTQIQLGDRNAAAGTLSIALKRAVCNRDDIVRSLIALQRASAAGRGGEEPAKTL